jgi:hypothetical protein
MFSSQETDDQRSRNLHRLLTKTKVGHILGTKEKGLRERIS